MLSSRFAKRPFQTNTLIIPLRCRATKQTLLLLHQNASSSRRVRRDGESPMFLNVGVAFFLCCFDEEVFEAANPIFGHFFSG